MTTDLKTVFRLLKYTFQLKTNCVSAIIITILGFLFLLAAPDTTLFMLGGFYFALGPLCILQMQFTLLYSNLGKSSPKARMLEISSIDTLSAISILICYTFIAIYITIRHSSAPTEFPIAYLFTTGLMYAALLIYFSLAYKTYIFGIIFLIICTISVFSVSLFIIELGILELHLNTFTGYLLGYGCVFIGLLLSGLLRRLVYKRPLSKIAAGAKLRKQL